MESVFAVGLRHSVRCIAWSHVNNRSTIRFLILLPTLITIGFAFACGADAGEASATTSDSGGSGGANQRPVLSSAWPRIPGDGDRDIPLDTPITIEISRATKVIRLKLVPAANLELSDERRGQVASRIYTYTPSKSLSPLTTYMGTISWGNDESGPLLTRSWSFTTGED